VSSSHNPLFIKASHELHMVGFVSHQSLPDGAAHFPFVCPVCNRLTSACRWMNPVGALWSSLSTPLL
jgi:hypothetical protein